MLKKVAVLNDEIVIIYHNDDELKEMVIEGAIIEEREMEYNSYYGWVEKGFVPLASDKKRIEQLEQMINMILMGDI